MSRHGTVHPKNAPCGYPSRENTAWPHAGYEGAFSYCGYWRTWDKILGVTATGNWIVQSVDVAGNPLPGDAGRVRTHSTPIDLRLIYSAPF